MIQEVNASDLKRGDKILIKSMGGDLEVDVDYVKSIGDGLIELSLFEWSAAGELKDTVEWNQKVRKLLPN